jgi:membrane protein DedA with SNARE-associated domain
LLLVVKYLASLLLIFMGSMDCLTTVVGTLFFGTQELNPLIAGLVSANLPAFVIIKLAVTISVGMVFVLAERTLIRTRNIAEKSFKMAHMTLQVAYVGIILFLALVVINNIIVLLRVV